MVEATFDKFQCLTHFGVPQGSSGVDTNDGQKLKVCTYMLIHMRNLMVASIFKIFRYFTHCGAPQGQIGVK